MAPVRILLIEDVDLMARIYGERLLSAGFHVDRAQTGRDALGLCVSATYELILLDLTLPDMSGVEFLAALRSEGPPTIPPAVVLTNAADSREWEAALAAGASRVLVKSTSSPDEVAREVARILG